MNLQTVLVSPDNRGYIIQEVFNQGYRLICVQTQKPWPYLITYEILQSGLSSGWKLTTVTDFENKKF